MEKYGFVYLWRDRKHNRYYVGSHWGYEDDGYVCSSPWMISAYKRRPEDFKRKILMRISTSRSDLLQKEFYFLSMIKENEIAIRYYNLNIKSTGHWMAFNYAPSIKEKISISTKEARKNPKIKAKYDAVYEKRRGSKMSVETCEKKRLSMIKTMAEKYPEENRRKPLSDDERQEYYVNKAKTMHKNRSEDKKIEIGKKISESNRGKKMRLGQTNSEEHRQKISEGLKGKVHKRHRIMIDGVVYISTHKAEEVLDISVATINRRLNNDKYPNYVRLG